MQKSLKFRNRVSLYVRDPDKEPWEKFVEEVHRDSNFKDKKAYKRAGLTSIAIMSLIKDYLNRKQKEIFDREETERLEALRALDHKKSDGTVVAAEEIVADMETVEQEQEEEEDSEYEEEE